MHILIVDDEALARQRLRQLLCDDTQHGPHQVHEASSAQQALQWLQSAGRPERCTVLLDIHMPGMDGLGLATQMQRLHLPPTVIFITADAGHALSAFELDATDYLTKPVRLPRLQQALQRVRRNQLDRQDASYAATGIHAAAPITASRPDTDVAHTRAASAPDIVVQGRQGAERIPWSDVLYLRAEQKYLTLRTQSRSHVLDGALSDWELRMPEQWLRIHRSTLVARHTLRAIERLSGNAEGDTWAVRLHGLAERLPVSRRQLSAVREALVDTKD